MWRKTLIAAVTFLVAGAAWADSHASSDDTDSSDDADMAAMELTEENVDLEAAKTIFQRNCRACHGNRAQGVASYPKLSDKEPDYIVDRLETYRAGERIGPNSVLMIQNAKDLTDDEIAGLALYVTTAFE